ncbi:MAG: hypothetical protein P1V20_12630 [Verrucomicrobiales bacterium]|nr:hypothetical protein [Verrucomicrobiales bacterium]
MTPLNQTRTPEELRNLAESLGPAERLLDLIINFPDHLWHNRPGVIEDGKWKSATKEQIREFHENGQLTGRREFRQPGPNVEAIERVYGALADIWTANNELAARLASNIMLETDWRDMKVVCAAFMLVQKRSGEPIFNDARGSGREVLFYDDDFREVGEAMVKFYRRGSNKMMNPKLIQRVGQVLSLPGVADMNRTLEFGNPQKRKAFTGRYYKAVRDWITFRESNESMLAGLKRGGFANSVKSLSRMVGYKPQSQRYFEILDWPQKQHSDGHRSIGLNGLLSIEKVSFDGLSEAEICEKIISENLGWKQIVGLLPKELGLTPAIFVAAMPRLSDKELVILTPTFEEFGLLDHPEIKERWQSALSTQEDQRSRHIAKNLKNRENAAEMEQAADKVVAKAVESATREADIHIQFIIDISASMEGAIDLSKEALSMIAQGFPQDRVHISAFNTVGYLLRPRHWSGKGIDHMLQSVQAGGGTNYSSGLAVFRANRVRVPDNADLILFCVGDEAGESGENFARFAQQCGYQPSAIAHIVNVAKGWSRGSTVRRASEVLGVPYTEMAVEQFTDVYQVQRTLKALLESQPYKSAERVSLVEKILQTPLLTKPY